ncbi:MAG TPA: hypothetical protein VJA47_02600 [archaeon]|nr:hypothetical protein [archaeon]
MKTPFCEACLKSGLLCTSCKSKIDSGEVRQELLDISKLILEESGETKGLKDVKINNVIGNENLLLIICGQGDSAKLVGKGGSIVKKISEVVGKRVRIVEESDDPRTFVQNLVFPAPVLNLNTVYTSNGEKYKVVIPANSRLPLSLKDFTSIAKSVLKKDVEVGFEGERRRETTEDKINRLVKKIKS